MTTARNWRGYFDFDPPSINWEPGSTQLSTERRLVVGRSPERMRITIYNGTGAEVTLWAEAAGGIRGYPIPDGSVITIATQAAIWANGAGTLNWFVEHA